MVLAWSLPGVLAGLGSLVAPPSVASPAAVSAGALALLASPAKGLLLFVPVAIVALVGLVRSLRAPKHRMWDQAQPSRLLPLACLAAATAHVAWLAAVGGWNEGPFWGPRLARSGLAAAAAVPARGLRGAADRGEHPGAGVDRRPGARPRELRRPLGQGRRRARVVAPGLGAGTSRNGPIAFHARERVARVAVPALEGRRLTSHERTFAPSGHAGSFVSFARIPPAPTGADQTFDGLRFDGGARFEAGQLVLAAEGDGVGFRVRDGARPRRLEIRVAGRGSGRLGLAESGSAGGTRWRDATVSGPFRLRLPYFYADSGGADLRVVLRSGGPVAIDSIALVPPSEPDNVLRLP